MTLKKSIPVRFLKIDERKISAQRDYDSIINQLYEVYEMTRSEAENAAEKINDRMAAQKELNEIKMKIRALGNVNVGAIEEYKEVSERFKFLSEQLTDVRTSKRDLEKLIEDLTGDMCRIFAESFVIINNNFKSIFTELFGGGKAELVQDPENGAGIGGETKGGGPRGEGRKIFFSPAGESSRLLRYVFILLYLNLSLRLFVFLMKLTPHLTKSMLRNTHSI